MLLRRWGMQLFNKYKGGGAELEDREKHADVILEHLLLAGY